MNILAGFRQATRTRKVAASACILVGLSFGAVGLWLLNPLSASAWCRANNGCAFWPDNVWVASLALSCDAVSISLLLGSAAVVRARRWLAVLAVMPGLTGALAIAVLFGALMGWY